MKPLKRPTPQPTKSLDPTWWRKISDGYDQQDGRARLVRLKTGHRVTGWALYVDGECVGSWPSLAEAKERAAKRGETWTEAQRRLAKPLQNDDESAKERAIRVMATGWCPWPYLRATAPGGVGLDYKADCSCGKRVRVTARGLLSHHKMLRRVSADDVRRA